MKLTRFCGIEELVVAPGYNAYWSLEPTERKHPFPSSRYELYLFHNEAMATILAATPMIAGE